MPYEKEKLATLEALKELAASAKVKIDELTNLEQTLRTQIQTLEARYDTNVKASTDSDADYAAEVVDARVDAWGNEHPSAGSNIRAGQTRLDEEISSGITSSQNQIDALSEARMLGLVEDSEAHERRKKEITQEISSRSENDDLLQSQVNKISEATLGILVMLSEVKDTLRRSSE